MPEPKPPYKLTIKLTGARTDRIAEALNALRDCLSDHDQTGETSASAVVECWKESDAQAVAEAFEDWLYRHAQGLDTEMTVKRPGIRPETFELRLREARQTPMDKIQGFAEKHGATVEFSTGDDE